MGMFGSGRTSSRLRKSKDRHAKTMTAARLLRHSVSAPYHVRWDSQDRFNAFTTQTLYRILLK
jgi:hypothetical protein